MLFAYELLGVFQLLLLGAESTDQVPLGLSHGKLVPILAMLPIDLRVVASAQVLLLLACRFLLVDGVLLEL